MHSPESYTVTGKELLEVSPNASINITGNWIPSSFDPQYGHNFPLFHPTHIPTILRDTRVRFGLNLIKAPIENFTIFLDEEQAEDGALHETIREQGIQFPYVVKCKDQVRKDFILKTLRRVWQKGLKELLSAVEWGFSCNEVIYKQDKTSGQFNYFSLKLHRADSVVPLFWDKSRNALYGAELRGIPGQLQGKIIRPPKMIWHVHAPEVDPILGQSRLFWCFVPWHETWVCYGARDIRRTWFHRNSFNGGQMRYPVGVSKDSNGIATSNDVLANQVMANIRSGGYLTMPSQYDQNGKPEWEYIPPDSNVTPQGLMEYPEQLRVEILEGLGIPPEVIESESDGGFGSATGRKVPLIMYYSSLSSLVSNVICDIDRYIIDPLLRFNFSESDTEYEIERLIPLKSSLPEMGGPGVPGKTRTDPIENTEADSGLSN